MTQTVTLPDGSVHNFPDQATPEMIAQALNVKGPDTSFSQRMQSDATEHLSKMQDAANAYVNGQQSMPETMFQQAMQAGQLAPDMVTEGAKSAFGYLPSGIQDKVKTGAAHVYSAIANSPVGVAAHDVAQAYDNFAKNNPRAARDIGAAGNALNLLAAVTPIKGTGAAARVVDSAGTALQPAAAIAGKAIDVVRPSLGSDQELLQNMGVRLTSGQRSGGLAKDIENKATSLPLTGDLINKAYGRSVDDFNRGVSNEVLSSIGQTLPDKIGTGNDAIAHVEDAIGKSYDETLSKMNGVIDPQFTQEVQDTLSSVRLPDDKMKQLENMVNDAGAKYVDPQTGTIDGKDNKEIIRRLRFDASRFSRSQDPDQQTMGAALNDIKNSYTAMLQRNNAPELSEKLANTDLAFAKFVRLQKAGVSAANNGGVFTPAQFMSAVRGADNSVRKGAVARGDALMQNIALAGQNVLPNKIPDSGTAGRALMNAGALATLGGTSAINPLPALAVALSAGAYTKPGQAILRKLSDVVRK